MNKTKPVGAFLNVVSVIPRVELRKLENLAKKFSSVKWSIIFNIACLREDICPKYILNDKKVKSLGKIHFINPNTGKKQLEHEIHSILNENIRCSQSKISSLLSDIKELVERLTNLHPSLSENIHEVAKEFLDRFDSSKRVTIVKKLSKLYGHNFILQETNQKYINISNYKPSVHEHRFLNLGFSFPIPQRYDSITKKTELEILYQQILSQHTSGRVRVTPCFADRLRVEGQTDRHSTSPFPLELRKAARSLRDNADIVIRRCDKSATYAILNKDDYFRKLDDIISDTGKFQQVDIDPTSSIKVRANSLVARVGLPFRTVIGDYSTGYLYGNAKVHKLGCPLRPIISQVNTPTHEIACTLVKMISPYIPCKYRIRSTDEFLRLLKLVDLQGYRIGSLDVTSLFTNIPVRNTIDIVISYVYSHPTLPPPKISAPDLSDLLHLCVVDAPFRHPDGRLFLQRDGVAMGSPLGPILADCYMGYVEESVIPSFQESVRLYVRYVDDIFVVYKDDATLNELRDNLEKVSGLQFTTEHPNENGKLPFLDVLVGSVEGSLGYEPFRKPSNNGECMRGDGYCPFKYRRGVIIGHLHRLHRSSPDPGVFGEHVGRLKNVLVQNGYTNSLVDSTISSFIRSKKFQPYTSGRDLIKFYYRAQMHDRYMVDELAIRDIVHQCVRPSNPSLHEIQFNIYYRSNTSRSLIMKNSFRPTEKIHKTNVVYKFSCPLPHNIPAVYVGHTRCTLDRRLMMHTHGGNIRAHFLEHHQCIPDRQMLVRGVSVVTSESDPIRLKIKEALYITSLCPSINVQGNNFFNILRLFPSRIQRPPRALSVASVVSARMGKAVSDPNISGDFCFKKSLKKRKNVILSESDSCVSLSPKGSRSLSLTSPETSYSLSLTSPETSYSLSLTSPETSYSLSSVPPTPSTSYSTSLILPTTSVPSTSNSISPIPGTTLVPSTSTLVPSTSVPSTTLVPSTSVPSTTLVPSTSTLVPSTSILRTTSVRTTSVPSTSNSISPIPGTTLVPSTSTSTLVPSTSISISFVPPTTSVPSTSYSTTTSIPSTSYSTTTSIPSTPGTTLVPSTSIPSTSYSISPIPGTTLVPSTSTLVPSTSISISLAPPISIPSTSTLVPSTSISISLAPPTSIPSTLYSMSPIPGKTSVSSTSISSTSVSSTSIPSTSYSISPIPGKTPVSSASNSVLVVESPFPATFQSPNSVSVVESPFPATVESPFPATVQSLGSVQSLDSVFIEDTWSILRRWLPPGRVDASDLGLLSVIETLPVCGDPGSRGLGSTSVSHEFSSSDVDMDNAFIDDVQ